MILKLNIKSIIKFEQLTNKSFNSIEYTNENDLLNLLYCMVLENNDELFTIDEFKLLLNNQKIAKEIFSKFSKIIKLIESFSTKIESEIEKTDVEKTENLFIKDIASVLIINAGIDINYVMNDLSIQDIGMLMTAYNEKIKQEMEQNRLWCYLSIMPHIDNNKIDSPQKLYSFPWDSEIIKIDDKQQIINNENEFREMMKQGVELIEKINNKEVINK